MKVLVGLLTTKPWIGDVASIAGFFMGLLGFGWTIWFAWRSKKAAEQAREEAQRVSQALAHTWTVADLSAVIAKMDEIKRLHRTASLATDRNRAVAWTGLFDRYTELRQLLIAVRERSSHLRQEYQTAIQSALVQLKGIEDSVEKSLFGTGEEVPDPVDLNLIVSGEMDNLMSILEVLKHEVET